MDKVQEYNKAISGLFGAIAGILYAFWEIEIPGADQINQLIRFFCP